LLVDGDLRSPSAHLLFNVPLSPGLADVLRGKATVAEAAHPTPVPNLFLMPAGECDPVALQSLNGHYLAEVFTQVRERFDSIIVDTSPVLPVPDALLIARHVDGAVISLLQGVSRVPYVEEATHKLSEIGVRILGAVVNGTAHQVFGYGYGYRPRSLYGSKA
jgi:capsular exopolysaccharide synthesis family protein